MADTNSDYHVVGAAGAVTYADRGNDRPVQLPRDLPGIVIFLHGVNDPGAIYSFVEDGICKGLNERLSRNDLSAGSYGATYSQLKAKKNPNTLDAKILTDPDTYLYRRQEIAGTTKSSFIPFYWGYRAQNDEIARLNSKGQSNTEEVKGGVADKDGNLLMRDQYQDIHGNRLDKHFGKAGGFFANATNNIPQMYGEGFRADWAARRVTKNALGGNSMYAADAPERRYFVLAATRLAHLINMIRSVQPSALAAAQGMQPEHETITIMGHSQGTILTLLAQAILKQKGQRCVDCIIMVDTPYSLYQTDDCNQTGHAKLKTLIDIVNEVTKKPYTIPDLADMMINHDKHGGRAGTNWSKTQGKRLDKSGKNWVTFDERDNRGKVYLYFCPEDTVVGLKTVHGIGTFGVPDEVPADGAAKNAKKSTMDAMKVLETKRFFQRMWTRMTRDNNFDGKYKKVLVGTKPARVPVREQFERLSPGPDASATDQGTNAILQASFKRNDIRFINGEELKPPCEPDMYGGEVKGETGGSRPGYADRAGKMIPDDVTKNVIVGNQYADLEWKTAGHFFDPYSALEKEKAEFNANKPVDEQSQNWRVSWSGISLEREETPKEARERMQTDKDAYEANNYHSGLLHAAENHRWVTAMDVAIGQAVTMDDPVWHELLVAIADWKLDPDAFYKIKKNKAYTDRLTKEERGFIEACKDYYQFGTFPGEQFVSMTMPPLVTSELTPKATAEQQQAADLQREAEMRFYQNQAAQGMARLGSLR
ncbi:T6SS effector phospholipase Tle3 domain-containing protein [Collimonas sp.]|jgi:hypothetical protein|uniref:T6SS effector phospholipase Tle3 domain-containing protein n=1 Tax=Collimonas sp. TaxID=1963772 RepID=UPI002CA74416|nr:DUF3274 domain-containing protein [Collimonas sp.]HWX03734.1 DUF3274 domain-containing protein [Collimonas sp.]